MIPETPSEFVLDYLKRTYTYDNGTIIANGKPVKQYVKPSGHTQMINIRLDTMYESCYIVYKPIMTHHLVWFLCTKVWPSQQIDHIDGNPANNRIENLRLTTHTQNLWNQKKQKGTTSTYKGVKKQGKKWRVTFTHNRKQIHVGYFITEVEAAQAYNVAISELRGEYARLNIIPTLPPKAPLPK